MSFTAYPVYKDSGDEWLGKVPEHWQALALSRVLAAPVTDGPHTTPEFLDDGVPFLSVDGIQDGKLNFEGCRYVSFEDHKEFSKKAAPRHNDLLMGKAASVGKIARVTEDIEFSIWSPLALIRVDGRQCSPEFLEFCLKSSELQHQVLLASNSNTQLNIGMKDIPKLRIPLPTAQEQTQIARFLDHETTRIDALIEEQQRLIELLKEKRQAVISQAVTKGLDPTVPMKDSGVEWLGEVPTHWPLPKLGHLARVLNGSTPSRENMDYWSDGDIPWVASGSLNDYRIDLASEFITKKALKECSVEMIPRGAILVGLVGQGKTRGLAALLNIEATINQNVCAVVPDKEKVLSGYLHLYLHCIYEPLRDFGRGANQAALNCELVSALRIPLPCMEEQSRIVKYIEHKLNEFHALEDYAQRSIGLMQERRSALISAAATGKIDVRGWQPPVSTPTPELAVAEAV